MAEIGGRRGARTRNLRVIFTGALIFGLLFFLVVEVRLGRIQRYTKENRELLTQQLKEARASRACNDRAASIGVLP